MTVKFGNVFGSTKNDGTNHTAGRVALLLVFVLDGGLTALTHASFRLGFPNVHASPANVDTSILPLYWYVLVLLA